MDYRPRRKSVNGVVNEFHRSAMCKVWMMEELSEVSLPSIVKAISNTFVAYQKRGGFKLSPNKEALRSSARLQRRVQGYESETSYDLEAGKSHAWKGQTKGRQ